MTEVYLLNWDDGNESSVQGVFASEKDAHDHMQTELKKLKVKFQADILMWKEEATKTSGQDQKHCLFLAGKRQEALDMGIEQLDPNLHRYPQNTLSAYRCCFETFYISKWAIGEARKIFEESSCQS